MSDVHARLGALARSLEDADVLICLGDLVLFLDYEDPARGIFGELLGAENARRFVDLRTAGRLDEARAFSAGLWAGSRWGSGGEHARRGPAAVRTNLRRAP